MLQTDKWPRDFGRVITTQDGKGSVPADVYLGYGPVLPPSKKEGRTRIEVRGAIGEEQEARLVVLVPESNAEELRDTLALINWFGSLGSRARNGWGSVTLRSRPGTPALPMLQAEGSLCRSIVRPWKECLDLEWGHALGLDETGHPLVWFTEELSDWRKAMTR